jgi:hypothetical protein
MYGENSIFFTPTINTFRYDSVLSHSLPSQCNDPRHG